MDGDTAQWYARSRYTTDDFDRMERQRILQQAILAQFTPQTVLTRFQDVATAGADIVQTDLPQSLIPFLADLALKAKELPVTTIELTPDGGIDEYEPDFAVHPGARRSRRCTRRRRARPRAVAPRASDAVALGRLEGMTATLRVMLDQLVAPTEPDLAEASRELARALVIGAPAGCEVEGIAPGRGQGDPRRRSRASPASAAPRCRGASSPARCSSASAPGSAAA